MSITTTGVVLMCVCMCEISIAMGKMCGDRILGSQCFNYNGSLLVPRNGPLPVVLKHSHPLLYLPCANVKKRISAPREGRAGSYWWSVVISGPNLPTSWHLWNCRNVAWHHPHSSIKANPTALSWWAFSLGWGSSKKYQLSMWKYDNGVCTVVSPNVFTFCLLRSGSPSLVPQVPHTAPPCPESRCSHPLGSHHSLPIDALITVRHVQEIVFLMVVLIQLAHGSACGRDSVVDKEEQGVLRPQVNPLPD